MTWAPPPPSGPASPELRTLPPPPPPPPTHPPITTTTQTYTHRFARTQARTCMHAIYTRTCTHARTHASTCKSTHSDAFHGSALSLLRVHLPPSLHFTHPPTLSCRAQISSHRAMFRLNADAWMSGSTSRYRTQCAPDGLPLRSPEGWGEREGPREVGRLRRSVRRARSECSRVTLLLSEKDGRISLFVPSVSGSFPLFRSRSFSTCPPLSVPPSLPPSLPLSLSSVSPSLPPALPPSLPPALPPPFFLPSLRSGSALSFPVLVYPHPDYPPGQRTKHFTDLPDNIYIYS